jgi:hypothetical protein
MLTAFIGFFDTTRDYYLVFTVTHVQESSVMSSMALLGIGFEQ